MRASKFIVVGIVLVALCLIGTASMSAQSISIGVIANLTGPDVRSSLNMVRGVEIGVAEINAQGGINGRTLKLITEDSEYRQQEAINAATKLYEIDGVEVAIMFGGSSLMIPVAELAEQKSKILMNTSSSSPKLGDYPGTLFSVLPLDDIMGKELGEWIASKGFKRAVGVVPNNTFGLGLLDATAKEFEQRGGSVARRVAYTEGKPDYRIDMQAAVQARPDVVISAGYGDDSRAVFKNARQLGLQVPWYVVYPTIFSVENEEWMSGKLYGIDNAGPSLKSAREVKQKYVNKYGEDPIAHVFYGYDAVWLVALAMRQGGTGAADIRKQLPQIAKNYSGATGTIEWDSRGQRIDPPIEYIEYKNGEFQVIDVER